MDPDLSIVSCQTVRKCSSIVYDAKFGLLVEAAGAEGLRFRRKILDDQRPDASYKEPSAKDTPGAKSPGAKDSGAKDSPGAKSPGAKDPYGFKELSKMVPIRPMKYEPPAFESVSRYLNVPTSHIAFTPYNMMLCCHGDHMYMVRHCTGRLVYDMKLDCAQISGAAFDVASDSLFVSDSASCSVICMQYMEFNKSRKLELKYSVTPSSLCIFANTILIPNMSQVGGICGLSYRIDDAAVFKISRVSTAEWKEAAEGKKTHSKNSASEPLQPRSLDGLVILPQSGNQQSSATTMIGISENDRALYSFKVRLRKVKEGSNQVSLTFKYKARHESPFITDREKRVPRSIAAISAGYFAVYYEVPSQEKRPESYGVMVLRLRRQSAVLDYPL